MAGLDVAILLAFVAYAVTAGLRARRAASADLEQYFLAGRTLPGWKAGLSMAASQFAADTPLLVAGLIATAGVFSLWRLWIYAVAFLLLGFVLATSWRRAGVITDAELTEVRYGGRAAAVLRAVKAIYFGTIFNCAVLSFVLLAATRIAEPFLLWDQWLPTGVHGIFVALAQWIDAPITVVGADPATWPPDVWVRSANNLISIAAILLVTAFYSTTGGLRSVVNTDVLQLALMLVATALFAWFVTERVGGLGAIPGQIRERFADGGPGGITGEQILGFTPSVAPDAGLAVLGLLALQWLAQMNADGTGYLAQRAMACRSDRDARQATIWFTVTQILVRSLLWLPLGLGLLLMFPPELALELDQARAEREFTYVRAMAELPVGLKGLLLTAMLAALASTVDTHLNWGASYWTNDIYKRFVCEAWRKRTPTDHSLVWVARGANLLILAIALVVMTRLGSIGAAWQTSLLLGAGMGGVLVLRWVWWRVTAWGELAAIVASALLAPILLTWDAEALRLLVMFAGSTATGVVVSLTWRADDLTHLVGFYRRARRLDPGRGWPGTAKIARCPRSSATAGYRPRMDEPEEMAVGLGGHGMLLSPVCPCRFAIEPGGTLWIIRGAGAIATVTPGARPAIGDLVEIDSGDEPAWRFGADGPTFRQVAGPIDQVLQRIDAGLSDAPWCILGPGFFVDLPFGFVGHSPTTADDPFPELHLRVDLRDTRTVPDAFIQFAHRPGGPAAMRIRGPYAIEESTLETARGPRRVWDYRYQVDGQTWLKRHYALPMDADGTVMMSAQVPVTHAHRMFEGAELVASSFAPADPG